MQFCSHFIVHTAHSLDGSKAHAIKIKFQAVVFDVGWIALRHASFTKLTTTTAAQIALCALASFVLDSLTGLT